MAKICLNIVVQFKISIIAIFPVNKWFSNWYFSTFLYKSNFKSSIHINIYYESAGSLDFSQSSVLQEFKREKELVIYICPVTQDILQSFSGTWERRHAKNSHSKIPGLFEERARLQFRRFLWVLSEIIL